jgi:hypothetical protein
MYIPSSNTSYVQNGYSANDTVGQGECRCENESVRGYGDGEVSYD